MKFLFSELAALVNRAQQRNNIQRLLRFLLVLAGFFTLYSVLFHFLMEFEGRRHSGRTGFYWTRTGMSTLGLGDIPFTSDLGRFFSIVVLLTGIVFLLVMLPFSFIPIFYAPWLEEQNRARTPEAMLIHPNPATVLQSGDEPILIGSAEGERRFAAAAAKEKTSALHILRSRRR